MSGSCDVRGRAVFAGTVRADSPRPEFLNFCGRISCECTLVGYPFCIGVQTRWLSLFPGSSSPRSISMMLSPPFKREYSSQESLPIVPSQCAVGADLAIGDRLEVSSLFGGYVLGELDPALAPACGFVAVAVCLAELLGAVFCRLLHQVDGCELPLRGFPRSHREVEVPAFSICQYQDGDSPTVRVCEKLAFCGGCQPSRPYPCPKQPHGRCRHALEGGAPAM